MRKFVAPNDDEHLMHKGEKRKKWKTTENSTQKRDPAPSNPFFSRLGSLKIFRLQFFSILFCLFDIERVGWKVEGGNNVSLCLCLGWWMCFLLLARFFFFLVGVLKQNEKWIYGVHSRGISETSIIVSNCVFALENWLQTFHSIHSASAWISSTTIWQCLDRTDDDEFPLKWIVLFFLI